MKEIPLTQGKVVTVDDEDYEKLNQYKWCALRRAKTFYAARTVRTGGKVLLQLMHRVLVGPKPKQRVDHIDHNGLNNQRRNLRSCTHSQNLFNQGPYKNNTSGFKGVSWNKEKQKWETHISCQSKQHKLGYFPDPVSAARAYNKAAKDLHGEFACLNQIPD